MKRFWCTRCQRVKRIRRLPKNVIPLTDGDKIIGYSEGTCDYHDHPGTRAQAMGRVRRVVVKPVKKQPVISTPPKSKKTR